MTTIESTGMTVHKGHKQDSGNNKPNLFKKLGILFEVVKEGFSEYNGICAMDEQTMEMYTAYRLPTPPADEPFQEEYPDEQNNPMLMEMQALDGAYTRIQRLFVGATLVIGLALIFLLFQINAPLWLSIVTVIALLVVEFELHRKVGVKALIFEKHYALVASLAALDSASGVNQTFWNFERWKKWGVARYDFESERELVDTLMSKKLSIARSGPMNGRILVAATGEEWPLKPVQAKTV